MDPHIDEEGAGSADCGDPRCAEVGGRIRGGRGRPSGNVRLFLHYTVEKANNCYYAVMRYFQISTMIH